MNIIKATRVSKMLKNHDDEKENAEESVGTDETIGNGASLWGRLKSGAGWISLDYVRKL